MSSTAHPALTTASSRLRKTFRYPDDNNDTDTAPNEGIDEEEQDKLIQALKADDARHRELYRRILLFLLPLATFLLPLTLSGDPRAAVALTAPSIISLILSFMTIYWIPTAPPTSPRSSDSATAINREKSDAVSRLVELLSGVEKRIPRIVTRYTIHVNAVVCVYLVFTAYNSASARDSPFQGAGGGDGDLGVWWRVVALSVVVFVVSVVARSELRELDVGELEGLRYELRGA